MCVAEIFIAHMCTAIQHLKKYAGRWKLEGNPAEVLSTEDYLCFSLFFLLLFVCLVWFGLFVWFGLVCLFGLVWFVCLVWFGLFVWFGLVWFGLVVCLFGLFVLFVWFGLFVCFCLFVLVCSFVRLFVVIVLVVVTLFLILFLLRLLRCYVVTYSALRLGRDVHRVLGETWYVKSQAAIDSACGRVFLKLMSPTDSTRKCLREHSSNHWRSFRQICLVQWHR